MKLSIIHVVDSSVKLSSSVSIYLHICLLPSPFIHHLTLTCWKVKAK